MLRISRAQGDSQESAARALSSRRSAIAPRALCLRAPGANIGVTEPDLKSVLEDLHQSLREEQRHLAWRPHLLFQQLYNRFRWREGPLAEAADAARSRALGRRTFLEQLRRPQVETSYLAMTLTGHPSPVRSVDISGDGTRILSGGHDGVVVLWDSRDGRTLAAWRGDLTLVSSCRFSPDGRLFATAGRDKTLKIWSVETGLLGTVNLREFMDHLVDNTAVRFSPDGLKVVSANYKTLKVWDVGARSETAAFRGHTGAVNDCAWAPDGAAIVSVGYDKTVRIWDSMSGAELRAFTELADEIRCCSWSPEGRRIASGSIDGTLTLWDADSGGIIRTLRGHRHFVTSCAFSPEGKRLASSSLDATVRIWDAKDGREIEVLQGHSGGVHSVAWSADGNALVSGGEDKTVRLWEIHKARRVDSYAGHEGAVLDCAWSRDGRHAVSAGREGSFAIWDSKTTVKTALMSPKPAGATRVRAIACSYSPDGTRIASATSDGFLHLWGSPDGRVVGSWKLSPGSLLFFAWSPDGKRLVVPTTAAADMRPGLIVVSTGDGKPLLSLSSPPVAAQTCSYSPDGRRILALGDDNTLSIWDAESGRVLSTSWAHADEVSACYWSPDSRHIVSASKDRTLRIWDTGPAGAELATAYVLEGHSEGVGPCAFSPDGGRLVSGSSDKTLRIWDCASGGTVAVMTGELFPIARVGWSPDGRWIASSTIYGGVRIWDGTTGARVADLVAEQAGPKSFQWSPDSRRIVHAGPENSVVVWDVERQREEAVYFAAAEITAFSLSPDGGRIVVGDVSGDLYFLRVMDSPAAADAARA
jgi:WD40 repeat protein